MLSKKSLIWVSAALLCTTLACAAASVYFYTRLVEVESDYRRTLDDLERLTIVVDIMVDYGNGTVIWNNSTRVGVGDTLLDATSRVAYVQYTVTEFGAFVDALNGVSGVENHYWLWFMYDGGWVMGPVGADAWKLHDGDIVAWRYTGF